jgi:trimethylamine:corrinoid methyltransferase-like protein
LFAGIEFKGEFLMQKATRQLFAIEQHLPSNVIDRDTLRSWTEAGKVDTFGRARLRLAELLEKYQPPSAREDQMRQLVELVSIHARAAGMDQLPATS